MVYCDFVVDFSVSDDDDDVDAVIVGDTVKTCLWVVKIGCWTTQLMYIDIKKAKSLLYNHVSITLT